MDFARKIQPFRSADKFQQVADALNGAREAQGCNVHVSKTVPTNRLFVESRLLRRSISGSSVYVDPVKGKDGNQNGSIDTPFLTIGYAVNVTRKQAGPSTIFLRKGTFYLDDTIELGPSDSGLTITNYQNEEVWISGGKVIQPSWKKMAGPDGSNIYMADLSSTGITDVPGFRVNNMRSIRARYPNADPELGFGSTLKAQSWAKPTLPA